MPWHRGYVIKACTGGPVTAKPLDSSLRCSLRPPLLLLQLKALNILGIVDDKDSLHSRGGRGGGGSHLNQAGAPIEQLPSCPRLPRPGYAQDPCLQPNGSARHPSTDTASTGPARPKHL